MGDDCARRRRFNRQLSKSRVLVECAFGLLKARFPALNLMGHVSDIKDLYRSIEALMVLHNICHGYHDTVSGLPDEYTQAILDRNERRRRNGEAVDEDDLYDGVGQLGAEEIREEGIANEALYRAGCQFRERCMDLVLG